MLIGMPLHCGQLLLTLLFPTTEHCPIGYENAVTISDHCYKLYNDGKTWQEAFDFCLEDQAELAEVKSDKENWPLVDFIQIRGRKDLTWLGANRTSKTGNFAWQPSGKPLSYANWHIQSGQPNNCCGGQHCLSIYSNMFEAKLGYWNDEGCDNKWSFICQKPKQKGIYCVLNWLKVELILQSK